MKTLILIAAATVALSGNAFALGGVNGTSLEGGAVEGVALNGVTVSRAALGPTLDAATVADAKSLNRARAAIGH